MGSYADSKRKPDLPKVENVHTMDLEEILMKKILTIVALSFVFAFAGCKSTQKTEGASATETTTTQSATSTETAAPTAAKKTKKSKKKAHHAAESTGEKHE